MKVNCLYGGRYFLALNNRIYEKREYARNGLHTQECVCVCDIYLYMYVYVCV